VKKDRTERFADSGERIAVADGELSAQIGPGVSLVDIANPVEVIEHLLRDRPHHIVQRNGLAPAAEIATANRIAADPSLFLAHPISTILSPHTASTTAENVTRLLTSEFCTPFEKDDVLQSLSDKLYGKVNSGLVSDTLLIADELYTNAILNAPFKTWGQELGGTHRKMDLFHGLKVKPAQIVVGLDAARLVIGCIDDYGSLDPLQLLTRIKSVLVDGLGQSLNFGPTGGAGIGSTMIFSTCASLYFGVKKGVRTVICAELPLNSSRKARTLMPKNIHVVIQGEVWY
jgi:hypothetical protein